MTRPSDTEAVTLTDDEKMTLARAGVVLSLLPVAGVQKIHAAVASILTARLAGAQVTEAAVEAAAEALENHYRKGDVCKCGDPVDRTYGLGAWNHRRHLARAALTAAVPHMGTGQAEAERAELEFLRERKAKYMAGLGERFGSEVTALAERDDLRARISALADSLDPINTGWSDCDKPCCKRRPTATQEQIAALLDRPAAAETKGET